MLKRRTKKLSKSEVKKLTGVISVVCSECNLVEVDVPADIGRVTCARCVQKMISPPPNIKKEKSDKPRGWHFKMYFEHDGLVYSKGELVTDTKQIAKLKNLTPVVTKKVVTKKKPVKGKKKPVRRGTKNVSTT